MSKQTAKRSFDDYQVGDEISFDGSRIGRVVDICSHPYRDRGYLLIVNASKEYTIYGCAKSCVTNLSLCHFIPEIVMKTLLSSIDGKESIPERKYPVIHEEATESPETDSEPIKEGKREVGYGCVESESPYFDFV